MATQREIKKRIKASKGIASVARALQLISANKIRRAQRLHESNLIYLDSLMEFTGRVEKAETKVPSSLSLFLIFTPERGLCGSLLNQITAGFLGITKINPGALYIFVGKKGRGLTKYSAEKTLAIFDFGSGYPTFTKTLPISKLVMEEIKKNRALNIYCLYPKFVNIQKIDVTLESVYPMRFGGIGQDRLVTDLPREEIMTSLELTFVKNYVYQKYVESFLSENAARMVAMTQASRNAVELGGELTHVLNQERQKSITTEILELKGGINNE
jgi:F-type H+-transporting ATPase subunit gamma